MRVGDGVRKRGDLARLIRAMRSAARTGVLISLSALIRAAVAARLDGLFACISQTLRTRRRPAGY